VELIEQPTSTWENLARSAENNHGRTLQPIQVREIMGDVLGLQQELIATQSRLNAIVTVTGTMVRLLGGEVRLTAEQMDGPVGFNITPDEEGRWLDVHAVDDVPVSEVQEEDEATIDSDGDLASVPIDGLDEVPAEAGADEADEVVRPIYPSGPFADPADG
jgi:hypothetical protein